MEKELAEINIQKTVNEVFLRVYSKEGKVFTLPLIAPIDLHERIIKQGWKHTVTMNAGRWIERLMNGDSINASDMMDELNLGKTI